MPYTVHKLYLLHQVLNRYIGYLVGARLVLFSPSCSPIILRKSHQSVPYNSERFKMADQNVSLGSVSPPPTHQQYKVYSVVT